MATDRRVSRIASQVKREVSQMLMSGIKDDRVGMGMVSVTEVEVSGDLQHAKVFVSIYGDETARSTTMEGLRSATGYVRSQLGHRLRLRRTPDVLFVEDLSIERGTGILSLINRLSEERQTKHYEWDEEDAASKVTVLEEDDLEDEDLEEDDDLEDDDLEDDDLEDDDLEDDDLEDDDLEDDDLEE